ncbi:sporulation protein YqfD [Haloimpatiens sp. FM7330]
MNKYKKGTILLEIQSLIPEKFVNLLWKNGIYVEQIKRKNITTMCMKIKLKDYYKIKEISQRTNTKIRILKRQGISFWIIKRNKVIASILGCIIFISLMYYLSTFIWKININTEKYISPYEIRQQLKKYGIKSGIRKHGVNVHELEKKILKDNNNISWVKVRVEGVNLDLQIFENQSPPKVIKDTDVCELVAKKDGEIVRVYTTSGTSAVEPGVIVKEGDVLVKGEQGKEGETYQVHAKGDVIAKTFYEKIKEVPTTIQERKRTGNKIENLYITLGNKKIYLKNSLNKFKSYDKIVDNDKVIKKEVYYEVKEAEKRFSKEEIIDKTVKELYSDIIRNMGQCVKIVDQIVDTKYENGKYKVRLLVIAEENIAVEKKIDILKDVQK